MQIKPKHIANWQILTLLFLSLGLAYALPLVFDVKPPRFVSPQQEAPIIDSDEAKRLRAEIALLEGRIETLSARSQADQKQETQARDLLRDADEKLSAAKTQAEKAKASLQEAQKRDVAAKQSLIEARQAEQEAQRALQVALNQLAQNAQNDREIKTLQASIDALSNALEKLQNPVIAETKIAPAEVDNQQEETAEPNQQIAQAAAPRRLPNPGKIIREYDDKLVRPDYVISLPADLESLTVAERKARFVDILLPLILRENQRLEARVTALELAIAKNDQDEINRLQTLYRLSKFEGDEAALIAELRLRIAPIPPSLALAQAAVESGWGLSRFAKEGNALFGQWAWSADAGIKPKEASNSRAVIRSFSTLYESVVAYMHNLNTHYAYAPLRERRAQLIAQGEDVTGFILAEHLAPYAETGEKYIFTLQSMIRQNRFDHYEDHQIASRS